MAQINFDMDFSNHPISKFLIASNTAETKSINYNTVSKYVDDYSKNHAIFYNNFIKMLNKVRSSDDRSDVRSDNHYVLCNSIPIAHITPLHRHTIRSKFAPNELLLSAIEANLQLLKLQKKQYSVIHIRTGDNFLLKNNKLNMNVINAVNNSLMKKKINVNSKYLILSDCNELKIYLKQRYPNFIININPISHLGENATPSDEATKNTLVDFFMMAHSNAIMSLSSYSAGSGFSKWCAEIYNIPCFCEKLNF